MSTYPANDDLPQLASIQGRWLLDESSGSRSDISGNSNTLSDNNTVGSGTGFSGNGASFDNSADFESGNSEYLSIADGSQSGLDITGDFSVSFWIKPESVGSYQFIMSKRKTSTGYYQIYIDNSNLVQCHFEDDSGNVTAIETSSAAVSSGTWQFFTFSVDVSVPAIAIYKDGSALSTSANATNATSVGTNSDPFQIGAIDTGSGQQNFVDGLMQDAIIWDTELSSTDVSDIYDLYTTSPVTFKPKVMIF